MSCDFTIYDMIARCAVLYPEKDMMVYEGNRSTFKTYKKWCDQYAAGLMRDKMLLAKGKITKEMIAMLSTWRHFGFHVFCGSHISPDEETAMENLARYIIYPEGHKQERMQYLDQEGKVVYTSKDKKTSKVFPALEWLANLCSHIPNRGEQIVRYYGHYSNVSQGKRQMEGNDDAVPSIIESQGDEKIFRRNWARLIQKIYEVDPLVRPKCKGAMRIVSTIEDPSVIRAILDHLGIWLVRSRPPPKIHDPPIREYAAVDLHLQTHTDDFYGDPEYS